MLPRTRKRPSTNLFTRLVRLASQLWQSLQFLVIASERGRLGRFVGSRSGNARDPTVVTRHGQSSLYTAVVSRWSLSVLIVLCLHELPASLPACSSSGVVVRCARSREAHCHSMYTHTQALYILHPFRIAFRIFTVSFCVCATRHGQAYVHHLSCLDAQECTALPCEFRHQSVDIRHSESSSVFALCFWFFLFFLFQSFFSRVTHSL